MTNNCLHLWKAVIQRVLQLVMQQDCSSVHCEAEVYFKGEWCASC